MSTPDLTPELVMAYVLFVDLVGHSRHPMDEQVRHLEELQEVVRQLPEFRRAASGGASLRIPTGDGMALVFFADPVAPVRCAIQMAQALRPRPHLQLRSGLHAGPVYRVQDINANANVSGSGINLAQRVMDCGDAGHILLSQEMAGLLAQIGSWPLQDLGECRVKHGHRLHLFNLYAEEFGNPRLPEKLGPGALLAGLPREGDQAASAVRVVLLCRRHAEPDGHVLALLERGLSEAGCSVFADRHAQMGMEWAREMEREIRGADVVVPLLSAASIHSEMLQYEIETACAEAEERGGRPRLLPVRVGCPGALPEALAALAGPGLHPVWEGPADDQRVADEVRRAVRQRPAPVAVPREKLEAVGGAVPLESQFYVVRPADTELAAALARGDSIILIKGARQMGKTSLLARGLQQSRGAHADVVRTDLQKLSAQHLQSTDTLFLALAEALADQLDLEVLPEEVWQPRRGPSENFERYLRRQVLREREGPLVWGLDEVDRLFAYPFASEVFGLFRSWHNERALNPEGPWHRLTLAIAYATEAHLFITDVNQSPFNVGTRLALDDFTPAQVAELNERYGSPLRSAAELNRFVRLLGGHPYLVRRGLHEMVTRELDIDRLEAHGSRDEGIFGDHLRRILVLLARDPALCEVVTGVLRGQPCPDSESFYRLRSAGVMAGESAQRVWPRCRLYEQYLTQQLA